MRRMCFQSLRSYRYDKRHIVWCIDLLTQVNVGVVCIHAQRFPGDICHADWLITLSAGGTRSVAMSYVCFSVCPRSHKKNSKTTRPNRTSPHFCARFLWLSVILWRCCETCDTLCTSGFVDNVMFSRNGPMSRHVYSWAAMEHDKHNSRESSQILRSMINNGSVHRELRTRGKVCPVRLPCLTLWDNTETYTVRLVFDIWVTLAVLWASKCMQFLMTSRTCEFL